MARNLFILIFYAMVAVFLGRVYRDSLRLGVVRAGSHTFRRDRQPVRYWIAMFGLAIACGAAVLGAALMAFWVRADLFKH